MSIVAMCRQRSLTTVYVDAQCEKQTTVVGRPNNNTQRRVQHNAHSVARVHLQWLSPAAFLRLKCTDVDSAARNIATDWLAVLSQ